MESLTSRLMTFGSCVGIDKHHGLALGSILEERRYGVEQAKSVGIW